MNLPFVRSCDTSQPTQSVPHPLKGIWADFVEEDYNADTSDPERVQILGDVDEWPSKKSPCGFTARNPLDRLTLSSMGRFFYMNVIDRLAGIAGDVFAAAGATTCRKKDVRMCIRGGGPFITTAEAVSRLRRVRRSRCHNLPEKGRADVY